MLALMLTYWAAKIVMSSSADEIRVIGKRGRLNYPAATATAIFRSWEWNDEQR